MGRTLRIASVFISLLVFQYDFLLAQTPSKTTHFLEPGSIVEVHEPGLQVFCHNANSKYLAHMWRTLTINFNISMGVYDLYDGASPHEVILKHDDNQRSWAFNIFGSKKEKRFKFSPFQDCCFGVYTYQGNQVMYKVTMQQQGVDVLNVFMMILGIITFLSARRLSKNPLFYYLCGILLGVTTSIVILIYLISKLFARGKVMYLMMATGWTMSYFLGQALWEHGQTIMHQYREWVMWYILSASLISFIICYRFGPVTNARTRTIIQWFLQTLGLALIYYSSYFREASLSCCVVLLITYNFPLVVIYKGHRYWRKMFPERRRLLTEDEYQKEGERETRKALKGLQEYCSSPECNQWRTILTLKNPIRFAKFMEGESHLSDSERLEHDAEITRLIEDCEYTDDDDDRDMY